MCSRGEVADRRASVRGTRLEVGRNAEAIFASLDTASTRHASDVLGTYDGRAIIGDIEAGATATRLKIRLKLDALVVNSAPFCQRLWQRGERVDRACGHTERAEHGIGVR